MTRNTRLLAAGLALVLAACRPGEVVVTAQIEVPDPGAEDATMSRTLSDLEIQLLPFDRDQVFDSLEAEADNPEPEIPAELLEAQDSIAAAQRAWQRLEQRWATLRDTLESLNETMSQYSTSESRYRELFRQFTSLEEQYNRVERQKDRAFEHFTSLQQASLERMNEIRIQRENWAVEAFADAPDIFRQKQRDTGLEILADTTDASGVARFPGVRKQTWWVHARYELPFTELYWNVPVDVTGGEPTEIRLTRANAEERPKL